MTGISGLSVNLVDVALVCCALILLFCLVRFARARRGKPQEAEAKTDALPAAVSVEGGVSPETIAAIVTALTAVWEGETGFVVRRVRRISNASAWSRAGRNEQIYSRF